MKARAWFLIILLEDNPISPDSCDVIVNKRDIVVTVGAPTEAAQTTLLPALPATCIYNSGAAAAPVFPAAR